MKRLAAIFAVAFLGHASLGAQAVDSSYFVVLYQTGTAWDPAKEFQDQRDAGAHSKHLARLRKEGRIRIGGRYSELGMLLLKAADEAEARQLVEADPAVQHKLFRVEIHAFDPFYSGCVD